MTMLLDELDELDDDAVGESEWPSKPSQQLNAHCSLSPVTHCTQLNANYTDNAH